MSEVALEESVVQEQAVAEWGRVVSLPGSRPLFLNIINMPSCTVLQSRRKFLVTPALVSQGDYSEIISELLGMRMMLPGREYEIVRALQWCDYWDVRVVGDSSPVLRLFASSSRA